MKERSLKVFYALVGIIFSSMLVGFTLLFWGFGIATERMNKQEKERFRLIHKFTSTRNRFWHDHKSPNALTSRLSDDAALLHAFAGEPIRTLAASLASVLLAS
jgi:ATP-binding cassette subfamily B (MDR/TAP) protein 1